ncbi:DUF7115 domain-containing protein [Natrarchaeobius chitinivorans]|uniref:DUF7115 domain-containing protein n=1 Tax=Natrarchaeobius chitinivorans TaxID=1679083 RepID=A0A3N6P4S6_NATCH|nr:hypothetical protein [Natrarchaeobius chitinivorans]RQG90445.1 hypothetical protein EA473_21095 [Natrarchaeobius chitinivorans]
MSVPGIVQSTLDDEEIAARVSLGGEDQLFITPTRTLVYRADGLLSDESVDDYPHDADRLTLSEGRRKTKFTLEYALEGTREFTVPSSKTDAALHPVLAGVLNGNDITEPGETVVQTYRFSELTLLITSDRLVKHIGGAVWDEDYEEYHFGDVSELSFEDGSVAMQIVLVVDGRPQRIKAPNEEANDLRERLKRALFDYHDVSSLEELNEKVGEDDETDQRADASMDFGDGVDPLDANPPEPDDQDAVDAGDPTGERGGRSQIEATPNQGPQDDPRSESDTGESAHGGGESAAGSNAEQRTATIETGNVFDESSANGTPQRTADQADAASDPDPELIERLDRLESAVDRQNDLIERQQETIDQLITELRRGR